MIELSVNNFRSNLKSFVDKAIDQHEPIKVTRREGKDFIVIEVEDWEREQKTGNTSYSTKLVIDETNCRITGNS